MSNLFIRIYLGGGGREVHETPWWEVQALLVNVWEPLHTDYTYRPTEAHVSMEMQ
jgi:hypothetical protein